MWGTDQKKVHEPDVRQGRGPFWFEGDPGRRRIALDSLARTLQELDFTAVVVVIRCREYLAELGKQAMDITLPEHPYHMALDFLSERLVLTLDSEFDGAIGRVIAESRGPLENAQLQHEFSRLHIDGTSYISDTWFRHQLIPGIQFATKDDYLAGLEVADLLARPCAEKVLGPTATPPRWPEFRAKLSPLQETAHSPLGIKVVPWSDDLTDFWKS